MTKARIVITAFNSDDDLNKCILNLSKQSRRDFEVVIVNNSANPINASDWADYSWLNVIQSDENTGFAGGSNLGANRAQTEWIITLNPDAWPMTDWFEKLMRAAEENPQYEMLSSTLVKVDDISILDGAGDSYSVFGIGWRAGQGQHLSIMPQHHRKVLAPCGAAAAYRNRAFKQHNGFDADYFCYLEDLDLGLRMQSQGQKCLHVFDAKVSHVGGGSTGENSAFQLYHTHKNQLRLIVKITPTLLLSMQLPLYFLTQLYLLIRTVRSPHWTSKLRGLKDGVLSLPRVMFVTRPSVQNARTISTLNYAKIISWSLRELRKKAIR